MQLQTSGSTLMDRQSRQRARRPIDVDLLEGEKIIMVARKCYPKGKYQAGDVNDVNKRFIEILENIRTQVSLQGKDLQPLPNAESYLNQLREVGLLARSLLPKNAFHYIQKLEERERDRGLSLDFTFPANMALLWEMVYAGNPQDSVDVGQFWGFRYPIGHLFWDSDVGDRIRLHRGAFSSVHNHLVFAKEEVDYLEGKLCELGLELNLEIVCSRLQDVIPQYDLNGDRVLEHFIGSEFAYGLVHFACHCVNPGKAGASLAYLSLAKHNTVEVNISLGKLQIYADEELRFPTRPFVFLNACESATPLHFLQSLNLPNVLLDFGAGGVIATACTLPDNFASAFAKKFYSCLFDKPVENRYAYIGEALLETRRYFMKRYNNPLGLVYGLYSLSNQWFQFR